VLRIEAALHGVFTTPRIRLKNLRLKGSMFPGQVYGSGPVDIRVEALHPFSLHDGESVHKRQRLASLISWICQPNDQHCAQEGYIWLLGRWLWTCGGAMDR
jgi:hypothetical protein